MLLTVNKEASMDLATRRRSMRGGISAAVDVALLNYPRPEPRESVVLDNTTRLFLVDVDDFLAKLRRELGDTVPRHLVDEIDWYEGRMADVLGRCV